MTDAAPAETFALSSSRHFPNWLAGSGASIAFTTYQGSKLFMVGVKPDGRLSVFERTFTRCMGLGVSSDGRALALATQVQIYRFDNLLADGGADAGGFDAVFSPHASWITGDVDAHDVGFGPDGRPVFVNTLFSCIAAVSDGHSFRPLWTPPFVSRLAAEDRCHLNGMALRDGAPTHATAVSRSDVGDGWRDKRRDGGVLIDVASGAVVIEGLSMPHSPRWHEGRLWLLNSGTGELGWVDLAAGRFEPVAFCPGYARGLAFLGNHAIVGLSLPRDNRTFSGLPLDEALTQRDAEARCGLAVIDLTTGDMREWVRIEGVVRELYDVAVLPGIRRPSVIGFKTDEIARLISIDEG
ncbi:MAG: TIGR03032 family protein [Alphaproteobacteria bacterium]|nr:TIGR03032 family protein [Alphaproteobacteria bacterium]